MRKEVQIILTANEGMFLTDGIQFVTEIRLPEAADPSIWHEIAEEKYNEFKEKEEQELF